MEKAQEKSLSVDDIALPTFPPQDYRVSKHSVYSDGKWDLSDDTDVRLKGHSEAKLSIDWLLYRFDREEHGSALNNVIAKSHLHARLSDGVIEDVRLVSFVQLEMPSVFGNRGPKIQRSKPPTVVSMARALVVLVLRGGHSTCRANLFCCSGLALYPNSVCHRDYIPGP